MNYVVAITVVGMALGIVWVLRRAVEHNNGAMEREVEDIKRVREDYARRHRGES
jgi:hypothetical protein